jgi:hypothetical protein
MLHWKRVSLFAPTTQLNAAVCVYAWPMDYRTPSVPIAEYLNDKFIRAKIYSGDESVRIRNLLIPKYFQSEPNCLPIYTHAILIPDISSLRCYLVDTTKGICGLYINDTLVGLFYVKEELLDSLKRNMPTHPVPHTTLSIF